MISAVAADPLLRYRDRFPILAKTKYLVSHSLGAMPQAARDALEEFAVVIRRGQVGLGQVGDLLGQSVDLSPGLLDEVDIILVRHGRPRAWEGYGEETAVLVAKTES